VVSLYEKPISPVSQLSLAKGRMGQAPQTTHTRDSRPPSRLGFRKEIPKLVETFHTVALEYSNQICRSSLQSQLAQMSHLPTSSVKLATLQTCRVPYMRHQSSQSPQQQIQDSTSNITLRQTSCRELSRPLVSSTRRSQPQQLTSPSSLPPPLVFPCQA